MNLWHFTTEDNTLFVLLSTHEPNMNITSQMIGKILTLTAKLHRLLTLFRPVISK